MVRFSNFQRFLNKNPTPAVRGWLLNHCASYCRTCAIFKVLDIKARSSLDVLDVNGAVA